jgi:ribulose-phosphate 3-epimerase
MELVPAILPASREDLREKLARLARTEFRGTVQIDAVDGRFALPPSWPFASGEALPPELPLAGRFSFDADLMVADPVAEAERYLAAGAARLTVHVESALDLAGVLAQLRLRLGHEKGFAPGLVSVGLALSLETPLARIDPHIGEIDYVQLMGIARVGRQHEPFDSRVVARVAALAKRYPELPIQVDGGVSIVTAPALLQAGAARLVAGHALFDAPDLASEIRRFGMLSFW